MLLLILVLLFVLLLCGIAFLVIRKLRTKRTRRPRARDLVPAHIQARRVNDAMWRHWHRSNRIQGVSPPGVAVRRLMKKEGRGR